MKGREICRKGKLKRSEDEIPAQIAITKSGTGRKPAALSSPDEISAQNQKRKGSEICRKFKLKRLADEIVTQIAMMKRSSCRKLASLSSPDEIPAQIQSRGIRRNLKIGSTAGASSAQIAILQSSSCRKLRIRPSLHEDIIALILSRLPVKSIFRFRSVSKSWCSLLSSKHFVNSHLQISIKNTNFSNNAIVLENVSPSTSRSTLKFIPLSVVLHTLCSRAVTYNYTFSWTASSVVLVGCSNGICCALIPGKTEKGFFLWNPSIQKSTMKFPKMEMSSSCTLCGFGFDESSDDFKALVGIVTSVHRDTIVYLFSFKSNSRKQVYFPIKGFGHAFENRQGAFANGKLYWLMIHDYDNDVNNLELDIVFFDLGTDMYGGVVEKPFYLNKRYYPWIGVLGGCLCVVRYICEVLHEIWVLKKNGVKEYWCKVMTLPFCSSLKIMSLKPLCITPDGVIMFLSEQTMYIYDPKNDSAPRLINYALLSQFNVCIQSLVFPFCDGEEENQKQWYERFVGEDVKDEHSVTIQDLRSRLEEGNPSYMQPATRSSIQQLRSSKRQRRSPAWMKDYVY